MASRGTLVIRFIGDTREFEKTTKGFNKNMQTVTRGLAGLGIAKVIKDSIGLEAQFSKTMNTLAAATKAPASEIAGIRDLAMKLGADTAFSANEAADAMLELGKAGIPLKDIMGGAAEGTLLLATAGGTNLASAATIASNAMNTFGLAGKDMGLIAAALAGGANASSASVESLGQALSQVGPGAVNAGLSLQQTVGVLSAFDAAGIKGSDAGTSLKTMLARLVPQTDKASAAMRKYNLDFVDAEGNFVSVANVARQLKKNLGGLGEAERARALNTIFGSDATRAATVLMKEGAKGIGEYITATKDQNAAQEMAEAAMSGTAGAMERLSGAAETAKLELGQALAPAAQSIADILSEDVIPALVDTMKWMVENKEVVATFVGVLATYKVGTMAASTVTGIMAAMHARQAVAAGTATTAQIALNAAMRANIIGIVVTAIAALAAGLVYAWKNSETFRRITKGAFEAIAAAGRWMWNNVLQPVFRFLLLGIAEIADGWAKLLRAMSKVPGFGWAKDAAEFMGGAAEKARNMAENMDKIPDSKVVPVSTPGAAAAAAAVERLARAFGLLATNAANAADVGGMLGAGRIAGERAAGGPVMRGRTYLVGEHGPELFTARQSGHIIPNHKVMRAAERMAMHAIPTMRPVMGLGPARAQSPGFGLGAIGGGGLTIEEGAVQVTLPATASPNEAGDAAGTRILAQLAALGV